MIKLIIKYIIIRIAALFIINFLWIPFFYLQNNFGVDIYSKSFFIGHPQWIIFLIRAVIAIIVWQDMKKISGKVNYLILVLILINDYAGTVFFLLSVFFNNYKSINITENAKSN